MSIDYIRYRQSSEDPIQSAQFNGRFQLFYCDSIPVSMINANYTIDELINTVNYQMTELGKEIFVYTDHRRATFDIPQFVKINRLYHSLLSVGNVKPFLLYEKDKKLHTITGESRLRAYELMPEEYYVSAFITTEDHDHKEWIKVNSFDEFSSLCKAPDGTAFYLRVGDSSDQDYGLSWYEVALPNTTDTSGGAFRDYCERAIQGYIMKKSDFFRFDKDWFRQHYNFDQYVLE
jgi:hypothetical protein